MYFNIEWALQYFLIHLRGWITKKRKKSFFVLNSLRLHCLEQCPKVSGKSFDSFGTTRLGSGMGMGMEMTGIIVYIYMLPKQGFSS